MFSETYSETSSGLDAYSSSSGDSTDTYTAPDSASGSSGSAVRHRGMGGGAPASSSSLDDRLRLGVVWSDISLAIKAKEGKRTILERCSGLVEPGEMIALMGPSGAGKSTLMSILSGRQTPDSGSVFIGGHDLAGPERETLLRHTAFVMQDDQLIGSLTVEENISFAARLKVHGNAELRRARVNEMIEILGLDKVRHSPVGDVFRRGVSGGERKRVSIAIELVTHPSVIFLDEPTSGLDSSAALHVMTAVKRYATRLKSSVVAVIHQPPSSVFAMFSGILLLADGQTVYAGDPDAAAELFEDQGVDVPQNFNTAEVLLDTLAKPHFTSNEREKRRALDDIAAIRESYRGSSERKKMCARASSVVAGGHGVPLGGGGKSRPGGLGTSLGNQIMTLVHRQFTEILRNPLFLWVRVALYAALGVMIATVWLGVDNDDPSTLQDRFSMFFFSVAFLCFCASSAVPAFVSDRLVFQRERASRAYGPFAYLVANTITSLSMVLLIAAVYSAIVYHATNLNRDPERVAGFCLALFLALLVAEWIVILISATTRYMIVGITIASMVNGVTMVVQGYFVRKTSLPGFYRNTLHYISYQKYAFEMMMTNDLRGDTFACGANADGSARCQFPTRIAGATRMTGEEILEDFTYEDVVYAEWAVILVALAVIARIITYTVLKLRK